MNKSKLCITTLVGALVLVSAFTASSRTQRYSDWSVPINLGPTVNSTAMDRAPAISKDGLSLYFASNRLDGDRFGGEDIYVSQANAPGERSVICLKAFWLETRAAGHGLFPDLAHNEQLRELLHEGVRVAAVLLPIPDCDTDDGG